MSLIHTKDDPLVTVNHQTGSVLVILNDTEALRFRSVEHFANWSEAFDRSSLHAFATHATRNDLPLPLPSQSEVA